MKKTEEYRQRMYEKWCSSGPIGKIEYNPNLSPKERKELEERVARTHKAIDDFYKKHPVD